MEEQSVMLEVAGALSPDQEARAEALRIAREVLQNTTMASRSAPDAMDLYNIAQYIIDGKDPWSDRGVLPCPVCHMTPCDSGLHS